MRVRRIGTPLPGGTMFVANHLGWMDIVVLHSQHMMGLIAKAEIRGWPLIGWLAKAGESIFLQRGNPHSLAAVTSVNRSDRVPSAAIARSLRNSRSRSSPCGLNVACSIVFAGPSNWPCTT